MYFLGDSTFIILIPGILLTLWAQAKVSMAYSRWSQVRSRSGRTGAQVAQDMLHRADLGSAVEEGDPTKAMAAVEQLRAVRVEPTPGQLTDHYDPRDNTLRLSEGVYGSDSIAALGIAAHEAGHAMQHATGYWPMGIRAALVPAAGLGSNLGIILFFLGLILSGGGLGILMDIGILLFAAAVLFTIVTLPVEFNASRRALRVLEQGGYLASDEMAGARSVLDAAALTYVAAAAMAVLTLIRLLLLRGSRDD